MNEHIEMKKEPTTTRVQQSQNGGDERKKFCLSEFHLAAPRYIFSPFVHKARSALKSYDNCRCVLDRWPCSELWTAISRICPQFPTISRSSLAQYCIRDLTPMTTTSAMPEIEARCRRPSRFSRHRLARGSLMNC